MVLLALLFSTPSSKIILKIVRAQLRKTRVQSGELYFWEKAYDSPNLESARKSADQFAYTGGCMLVLCGHHEILLHKASTNGALDQTPTTALFEEILESAMGVSSKAPLLGTGSSLEFGLGPSHLYRGCKLIPRTSWSPCGCSRLREEVHRN
jgi:hypothetical protein